MKVYSNGTLWCTDKDPFMPDTLVIWGSGTFSNIAKYFEALIMVVIFFHINAFPG